VVARWVWTYSDLQRIEVADACGRGVFFSGIFISAGTEGFNSLMKFANYKKESEQGGRRPREIGIDDEATQPGKSLGLVKTPSMRRSRG
jgi:hypothetical protein